jgi:hypothetical protein
MVAMWHYAHHKLREIGVRGIFAGWSLSFLRDSFGSALFFGTFEYVKSQSYYAFVTRYYGSFESVFGTDAFKHFQTQSNGSRPLIKPHYALEPSFILLAGILASVMQQTVVHPFERLQNVHYRRLESLDHQAKASHSNKQIFQLYYHAYTKTRERCAIEARKAGGLRRWLYSGFIWNTIRQVPSTSAGLIVFELLRRKWALDSEAIKIEQDGYDILLT